MHTVPATADHLPLERYRLFDSDDLDETRDFVGRMFCPHRLSTLHPGARLDARHHSVPLHRDASLNYVQYGTGVQIEPGYLQDFYLLQIPCGVVRRCAAAGRAWSRIRAMRLFHHPPRHCRCGGSRAARSSS